MVGYYQAYKGSTQTPLIYSGNNMVRKVYKGSTLVYQVGFAPITYNVSGSIQEFTVPLGVKKIHADCVASRGCDSSSNGGKGGRVQCDISVTGGQILYIVVGGIPSDSRIASYNASDIRTNNSGITNSTSLNSRLVVAGGGGSGSSGSGNTAGAVGGGLTGGNASDTGCSGGGKGGTQSAGGAGGANIPWTSQSVTAGGAGSKGLGGNGGSNSGVGGAGGAGYYGGGGGAGGQTKKAGIYGAGGGGGSSYTNANCSNVVHTQGYRNGAGYITISFVE